MKKVTFLSLSLSFCGCTLAAFSTSCDAYWALPEGFIHKRRLLEVDFQSFFHGLLGRALLAPAEYFELAALREKMNREDVARRLVCLMTWKTAAEQKRFLRLMDESARMTAIRFMEERCPGQ